jgi:hypothetical protein
MRLAPAGMFLVAQQMIADYTLSIRDYYICLVILHMQRSAVLGKPKSGIVANQEDDHGRRIERGWVRSVISVFAVCREAERGHEQSL